MANVHVSKHPCLTTKITQFRNRQTNARDTKRLVHEISLILGTEALATTLTTTSAGKAESPLGLSFQNLAIAQRISLVPVLRSGLGMVDAVQTLLPEPCPVHHLGLFREPVTLQPVEYYNNLPNHSSPPTPGPLDHVAIIVDPVIATGGTAVAAIQTLREWGVSRVLFLAVLGSELGLRRAAEEWPEGCEIWVGAVDASLDGLGFLKPGCGDVGDRLFSTKGK